MILTEISTASVHIKKTSSLSHATSSVIITVTKVFPPALALSAPVIFQHTLKGADEDYGKGVEMRIKEYSLVLPGDLV